MRGRKYIYSIVTFIAVLLSSSVLLITTDIISVDFFQDPDPIDVKIVVDNHDIRAVFGTYNGIFNLSVDSLPAGSNITWYLVQNYIYADPPYKENITLYGERISFYYIASGNHLVKVEVRCNDRFGYEEIIIPVKNKDFLVHDSGDSLHSISPFIGWEGFEGSVLLLSGITGPIITVEISVPDIVGNFQYKCSLSVGQHNQLLCEEHDVLFGEDFHIVLEYSEDDFEYIDQLYMLNVQFWLNRGTTGPWDFSISVIY